LDPEDVEAILRPYHERLRMELERFGGTVEKFIGDAVMALFGAPVAHEDDPERAVRAAAETHALQAESRSIHGDFERATIDLREAEKLVRDRSPSSSKARILAESARFHMVADRLEPAVRLGREAL